MKNLLSCIVAASAIASGCASGPEASTENVVRSDREYSTGSNIPRRKGSDPVQVMTPEELERMKNSSAGNTGRKPGG